ncbi:MAG: ATP-binding protein [Gammaproteobacteria bacterium]
MQIDLATLLAVRLGIDLLTGLGFLALMLRYPGIGGPGWWALSAVVSVVGATGLMMSGQVPAVWSTSLPSAMLTVSVLYAWMGLRSFLGLTRPLTTVLVCSAGLVAVQVLLQQAWDLPRARQLMLVLATAFIAVLVYRDIRRSDPLRRVPELQVVKLWTLLEMGALISFGVMVPLLGLSLAQVLPTLVLFALFSKLVRLILFGSLVSYRLRQQVDRARQELQSRESDSRALIENLSAGLIVFRPDQSIANINGLARCFLGWDDGLQPEGQPSLPSSQWQMLREDGQPMRRHEMPFDLVLASRQPVHDVIFGLAGNDGQAVRWGLCNAYPEMDALGRLRHVVFTFVDITSLRQAQQQHQRLAQQLSQSQKMEALGTLAGGVAHDFNNILAAILGNADLARQDLPPGSPARESLHEISGAARRGRELVRQILAYSRQQPLTRTPVRLNDIATETSNLLRTVLPSNIHLTVRHCTRCPVVRADATQIGQVILNLATNAIHALQGQPGRIELAIDRVRADDPMLPPEVAQVCAQDGVDAVSVSVSDSGCGMDEATRLRIFEPFFTTKPVGQGTGLGLPVVLGIVQAHGGAIHVRSEPGHGSAFVLYFSGAHPDTPAAQAGTMSAEVTSGTQPTVPVSEENLSMTTDPTTTAGRVLYLDDDDTLVFLVRRLLQRRGYEVTALCDQKEAIDAVRANPQGFDLLLTDYNMPGMSGIDVAREVLTINPNLTVAVASGYINEDLEQKAAAAGVREVVFKTDAIESFCDVVQRLVQPSAA